MPHPGSTWPRSTFESRTRPWPDEAHRVDHGLGPEPGIGSGEAQPELLDQVDEKIERFTGDGAYDTTGVYDAIVGHADELACIVTPPRKGATVSRSSNRAAKLRNENVEGIERLGRRRWKKESGYHQQGRAENTFYRYKRILGGRLRAIDPESHKREAVIGCNVLNRMAELGMPKSYSVG